MAENHVLLETIELTQTASSVTFDNIPQTGYTDLKIVISGRGTRAEAQSNWLVSFNGSTAADYSARVVEGTGTGSSTFNYARFIGSVPAASATASIFGNLELLIPNYTSNKFKSYSSDAVTENNSSLSFVHFVSGIWANTSAINSITISSDSSDSFLARSTFWLYGIAAVGTTPTVAPKATGGNTIGSDGTYWYHLFSSSGIFIPQVGLTCDYLVVAGGGGGGNGLAGGGGGGGFRTSTSQSLTTTNYTITVGAGGATSTEFITPGFSGSNSSIGSFSATGGGGGGRIDQDGISGGSGGGGGGSQSVTRPGGAGNAGSYSPVEGYAGGNGINGGSPFHIGGGGGGAGAVGSNATSSAGGNGGNGATNSYSGSSVTYAGGGGGAGRKANTRPGGTGGSGGGGNGAGSNLTTATAGTVNLGGGGGGGDFNDSGSVPTGGAGGSGIVIIRYAV